MQEAQSLNSSPVSKNLSNLQTGATKKGGKGWLTIVIVAVVIFAFTALVMVCVNKNYDSNEENHLNKFNSDSVTSDSDSDITLTGVDSMPEANNYFGFNVLQELAEEDKGENIFISPVSMEMALLMTYNGANENTADEMASVLGVSELSVDDVNEESKKLIEYMNNKGDVTMNLANSLWGRKDVVFKDDFLSDTGKYFSAKVESVDFTDPGTVDEINSWIEGETNDKIQDMLSEDSVNASTVLVLVNAIYFKGTWKFEFDKEDTQEKDFTPDSGDTVKVDMMYQESEDFQYFENDDLQLVELSYTDDNTVMYVALPKEGNNIDKLVASLDNANWDDWTSGIDTREGTVEIPKFKIEYGTKSVKQSLVDLGMKDAFETCIADFSLMSDVATSDCWYIDNVYHKSFVDVNEEGTEAAAATAVVMAEGTAVEEPDDTFILVADHPFFYAIADKESGMILFSGIMHKPEYE